MKLISLFVLMAFICSCQSSTDKINSDELKQITDEVRQIFVPDSRVGVFDIQFNVSENRITASGQTTSAEALSLLNNKLTEAGYILTDSVTLLPDTGKLGGNTYGIVTLSVCNMHSKPDFASEMVTQAVLGTPVRVLDYDNWYRIQTPDNYIAWVHRAGIRTMTKGEYDLWRSSGKVVVTAHYGFVYSKADQNSQTISDVVAGNRFRLIGEETHYYKVSYPDGRQGYLPKAIAQKENQWRASLRQDAASILRTAHTLMGVPYLWAGTSSKGMDCSGFVRNVLYMHDIIIPRDASQQAYVGKRIDINPDFSNLIEGDLVYFGRKATEQSKERVVHVGFYIGNRKFIHAQGDVRISSFDKEHDAYDEFNLNRLLFATRFLDAIGTPGINTTETSTYY